MADPLTETLTLEMALLWRQYLLTEAQGRRERQLDWCG